jgi:hypothetical protein
VAPPEPGPDRPFAAAVLDASDLMHRGRPRVVVGAVCETGRLPPPSAAVAIVVAGRQRQVARVASWPGTDVPAPNVLFLLEGVTAADVPAGARLTAAS